MSSVMMMLSRASLLGMVFLNSSLSSLFCCGSTLGDCTDTAHSELTLLGPDVTGPNLVNPLTFLLGSSYHHASTLRVVHSCCEKLMPLFGMSKTDFRTLFQSLRLSQLKIFSRPLRNVIPFTVRQESLRGEHRNSDNQNIQF